MLSFLKGEKRHWQSTGSKCWKNDQILQAYGIQWQIPRNWPWNCQNDPQIRNPDIL